MIATVPPRVGSHPLDQIREMPSAALLFPDRLEPGIKAVTVDLLPSAAGYGDLVVAVRLACALKSSQGIPTVRLLVENAADLARLRELYSDFPAFNNNEQRAIWRDLEVWNGSYTTPSGTTTDVVIAASKVCIVTQLMVVHRELDARQSAVNLYLYEPGAKRTMGVKNVFDTGYIKDIPTTEIGGNLDEFCETGLRSGFGLLFGSQPHEVIAEGQELAARKYEVLPQLKDLCGLKLTAEEINAPWGILYPGRTSSQNNCLPDKYHLGLFNSKEQRGPCTLFLVGSEFTPQQIANKVSYNHIIQNDRRWIRVCPSTKSNVTVVHIKTVGEGLFSKLLTCGELPAVVRSFNSFADAVLANQMIVPQFPPWLGGLVTEICEEAAKLVDPEDAARVIMTLSDSHSWLCYESIKASAVRAVDFFGENRIKIGEIFGRFRFDKDTPSDSNLYDLAAKCLRETFPDSETRLSREHIRLYHRLSFDPDASYGQNRSYSECLANRVLFSLDIGRWSRDHLTREKTGNLAVVLSSPSFRESFQRFNLALLQGRDRFVQSIVHKMRILVNKWDRDNDMPIEMP